MKIIVAAVTVLISTPALADPGHFAAEHGHSHWLAAGALALAAVIGATALWRSRKGGAARETERKA